MVGAGLLLIPLLQAADPPLPVVAGVELERYAGQWHEIASIPTFFTRGCKAASTVYSLTEPGSLEVLTTWDGRVY